MNALDWLRLVAVFVRPYVPGGGSSGRRTVRGDDGASLVEYALLVALIAVVCIIAITFLGRNASDKLSNVGSTIGN